MHVISKVKLREFWVQHADSEDALNNWYKFTSKANWSNLVDVQKDIQRQKRLVTLQSLTSKVITIV